MSESLAYCWEVPEASLAKLSRLLATSKLGQMVVLGQSSEVLQVAVAAGTY